MKNLIKLEELAQFLFGIFLFSNTDFAWWWFLVLILAPDVGMFGYLLNNKIGAYTYNIFHHKGLALILLVVGAFFKLPLLELSGIILFTHAAMDRMLGYGLKYEKGFKYTHLGEI